MNIYVAGKTQAITEVRSVQKLVTSMGHKITHDWTTVVEKNGGDANEVYLTPEYRRECALGDLRGVYYADVVIAIGHPNLCGTLWECGMAAAWQKPLWLLYWERCARASVFDSLENVQMIKDIIHLQQALYKVGPAGLHEMVAAQELILSKGDLLKWAARWDEGSLE